MKRMLKGLLIVVMSLSIGSLAADNCCCTSGSTSGSCCTDDCCDTCDCNDCCNVCSRGCPNFLMRSHSVNAARDIVGWQTLINKFEMEKIYGAFAITPEYSRSFKPCRISNYFFGPAMENGVMTISGSRKGSTNDAGAGAVARGEKELLADYFGLPTDYVGKVSFRPRISNFMLDLNLYLGLDELWEGGFFTIHAPITWTKWCLCPSQEIEKAGDRGFDAGYMGEGAVTNATLKKDWMEVMQGGYTFGDMKESLKYGKISTCCCTKTRLSDIQVALGWNFLTDEDYHFGLAIRAAFPTGNRPCSEFLFEPIVGNGRHWELGGGLTSHACLWTSDDEESSFSVYCDANVTHLFKDKQFRSFDFKDKPLSRYMLIEELGTPVTNLYAGTAAAFATNPAPSAQYQKNLFHAINKTTCCTDVSIAVQGDLAIKFAYMNGNFTFDLGYNLWGRSGEKFDEDCCTDCCVPSKKYAIKGDAFVTGWGAANANTVALQNLAIPLSATESKADIFSGTNTKTDTAFVAADKQNPRVDNVQLAFASQAHIDDTIEVATATNARVAQQSTSSTPKFISCDDLDTCKCPSALSHKVFAHFGYIWHDDEEEDEWVPFIGLGGEAEFAGKSDDGYGAVSQWGIWLKGGLAFN